MRLCGIVGGIFACTGEFGNARGISGITGINSGYILCVQGGTINTHKIFKYYAVLEKIYFKCTYSRLGGFTCAHSQTPPSPSSLTGKEFVRGHH